MTHSSRLWSMSARGMPKVMLSRTEPDMTQACCGTASHQLDYPFSIKGTSKLTIAYSAAESSIPLALPHIPKKSR